MRDADPTMPVNVTPKAPARSRGAPKGKRSGVAARFKTDAPVPLAEGTRAKLDRERVATIVGLLARCWGHARIRSVLAPQWGEEPGDVQRLIRKAHEELTIAAAGITRRERQEIARVRLEEVASRAVEAKQYGHAVAALDRCARLDGLLAPERIEISGPSGGPVLVGDATQALEALSRAIAESRAGARDVIDVTPEPAQLTTENP